MEISNYRMLKKAILWSRTRSLGDSKQDKECAYDFYQGMVCMQKAYQKKALIKIMQEDEKQRLYNI